MTTHAGSPAAPVLARLSEKQRAVADVIAGRASLLEAARRFRDAEGTRPGCDGETLCRSVIGWVHLALGDRPERADLMASRLERELQRALSQLKTLPVPA